MNNSFLILFILLLFTSCRNSLQNFNKQKFTNLKPVQNTGYVHPNDELIPVQKMHGDFDTEKDIIDEVNVQPENSYEYQVPRAEGRIEFSLLETELESTESPETKTTFIKRGGNPRDFEKLSSERKQEALTDFNRIFNNGLILFSVAALLALGAFSTMILLLGTGACLLIAWIMSFVALYKLRRIKIANQPRPVVIKFRLTQVVCGVGVAACIVTIVGGLVLLILWSAKVI